MALCCAILARAITIEIARISIRFMQPLNMTKAIMQDTDHHFENYKQYYNDVKQIELLSGVKFKTYNEYTKESHKWVRFVVSYYKRETVSILCDNKTSFDFSTKSMEVGDFIDDVKVKDTLSIVSTDNKKLTYRVNDHDSFLFISLNSSNVRTILFTKFCFTIRKSDCNISATKTRI